MTDRATSDGQIYTYIWSARNELLAEWTMGYPVRQFQYDVAGPVSLRSRDGLPHDGRHHLYPDHPLYV